MSGFGNERIIEILEGLETEPSFPSYQKAGRRLTGLIESMEDSVQPRRRARIAVLSSFTIDPIRPYLQSELLARNVLPSIYFPGYNQFAQEILSSPRLADFAPDVCFLHVKPSDLVPGESGSRTPSVSQTLAAMQGLVRAFRDRFRSELVISNFASPGRSPLAIPPSDEADIYRDLNEGLVELAKDSSGVHLLDFDRMTSICGKAGLADRRLLHLARMELGGEALAQLARLMAAWTLALKGLGRKVIVLDLDNTLWGGVVGEEGPAGIALGPEFPGSAFLEFQESLSELRRRGVLLAVASKNNESDALEVIDGHPEMRLRGSHFSALRINWDDKPGNVESMAEELNVGLESIVFIDDNPVERQMMRRLLPEVLTPDWPRDPVDYRTALERLCDFGKSSLTEEDRNRPAMYAARKERDKLRRQSTNLEEFYFSLRMQIVIEEARKEDLPRVCQLLLKTNQFNLTTRRHSETTVRAFHSRSDSKIFVLRSRDAFGENGLVGVAIVIREGDSWRIDTLLMSCRVLGRTIEQAFLRQIFVAASREGILQLEGEYRPTPKNAPASSFFEENGFDRLDSDGEFSRWRLSPGEYKTPVLPWIEILSSQGEEDSRMAS